MTKIEIKIDSIKLIELLNKIEEKNLIHYPSERTNFNKANYLYIPNQAQIIQFRNDNDSGKANRKTPLFKEILKSIESIKSEINTNYKKVNLAVNEGNEANFNLYPALSFIPPHHDSHYYILLTLLDSNHKDINDEDSLYYLNSDNAVEINNIKKLYHDFNNKMDKSEKDYQTFRNNITKFKNVCQIKLNKGDSILFPGGKYLHFTIPKFKGYREIFTLNFNCII